MALRLTTRPAPVAVVAVDVRAARRWVGYSPARRLFIRLMDPARAAYMREQAALLVAVGNPNQKDPGRFDKFSVMSWMGKD